MRPHPTPPTTTTHPKKNGFPPLYLDLRIYRSSALDSPNADFYAATRRKLAILFLRIGGAIRDTQTLHFPLIYTARRSPISTYVKRSSVFAGHALACPRMGGRYFGSVVATELLLRGTIFTGTRASGKRYSRSASRRMSQMMRELPIRQPLPTSLRKWT